MPRAEEIQKLRDVLLLRRDALRRALAGDFSALREFREKTGGDVADIAHDAASDELQFQLATVGSRGGSRGQSSDIRHVMISAATAPLGSSPPLVWWMGITRPRLPSRTMIGSARIAEL